MKHLKHCETSWNSRHSMRRYRRSMRRCRHSMWRRLRLGQQRRRSRWGHSMRRYRRSMRRRRRWMRRRRRSARRVSGDIGNCRVGITPQMCNRVTNHGDMSTFSKPVGAHTSPSGICLPGIELLQSTFRTELSMVSRLRWYWRSLWRHRQFMRSYRRSLRGCRDPWGDRLSPMRPPLRYSLNIIKHC